MVALGVTTESLVLKNNLFISHQIFYGLKIRGNGIISNVWEYFFAAKKIIAAPPLVCLRQIFPLPHNRGGEKFLNR
jgi:hypothetical protein